LVFFSNLSEFKRHTVHKVADTMKHNVFVYGTLKRGQPNHNLLQDENKGIKVFCGLGKSVNRFPMVISSRYNIPYVLDAAGKGNNILGEIYQ
jgi:gamma-glutamylaminecyclotransferase